MILFRQIFLLYVDLERVPVKNSALAWIKQKCKEMKERAVNTLFGTRD